MKTIQLLEIHARLADERKIKSLKRNQLILDAFAKKKDVKNAG